MTSQTPTGAEKLIQCLEREGVAHIFGLSGGAAIPIFDALVDSSIKLVLTRHEQGATHMADGYARATGRPGVALVTSGPGATNTVTGLLTALSDSVSNDRPLRAADHLRAGQGCLSGGRRHRHHLSGRQAQLSRQARRGHPAHHTRGLPRRDDWSPGTRPDRRSQGHHPGSLRRALHRRPSTCPAIVVPSRGEPASHRQGQRSLLKSRPAAAALRRPRRGDLGCRQGGARTCRASCAHRS